MSLVKSLYSAMVSIACTLTALATNTAQQSDAVDNSTFQYLDVQLALLIAVAAGTPTGAQQINIYVYSSIDGTNFDDPATGANGTITLGAIPNMVLLASINVLAGGKTYSKQIPSVATKLGGVLPLKWGLAVENKCGLALGTSTIQYRGMYAQTS